MTKKQLNKIKIKELSKNLHFKNLLKKIKKTGLFRWERKMSKSEEFANILTHGIGLGLSIAGTVLLIVFSALNKDPWAIVSCSIFGFTMMVLYFGSTMCHAMIGKKSELFFEVWDNIAIYLLIAGTYTPFLLVNIRGWIGWTVFGFLWAVVFIGTLIKIKNSRRQPKWIVLLYLLMGWTLLFILPAMISNISKRGMLFILSGGLSYSFGIIFYLWRKIKYSHAIWHLFVIAGSVCFFFAVLFGSIFDI